MVAVAHEELVLKPRRAKWLGFAALFAASIGLGVAMFSERFALAVCFFSIGVAGSLFSLWAAFSSRLWLRLTDMGFSFGSLRRRSSYRWSDIAQFCVLDFAGQRHVGFDFSPFFAGEDRLRRINQEFGRFDRFLPDSYGMKHDALARLLEEWRIAHTDEKVPNRPSEPTRFARG